MPELYQNLRATFFLLHKWKIPLQLNKIISKSLTDKPEQRLHEGLFIRKRRCEAPEKSKTPTTYDGTQKIVVNCAILLLLDVIFLFSLSFVEACESFAVQMFGSNLYKILAEPTKSARYDGRANLNNVWNHRSPIGPIILSVSDLGVRRGRGSEDEGAPCGGSTPASSFPRHLTVVHRLL
jgi:hypothetical protein